MTDEGKLLALFRQVVREEFGEAKAMVVSLEEASKRLDVSGQTLRRMVKRGELSTVPVGRTPKVPVSEIRRLCTPSMSGYANPKPVVRSTPKQRKGAAQSEAQKIRARLAAKLAKRRQP
jgi:excisionase family DNA binding protein